jgi:hypothetical protein
MLPRRGGLDDVLLSIAQSGSKFENELHERVISDDRRPPDRRHQFLFPEHPFGVMQKVLKEQAGLGCQIGTPSLES